MQRSRVSALALAACLTPGALLAQSVCLPPGALVTIDASGVLPDLGDGQPGIVLAHSEGRTRARVVEQGDDGTLTFQVPLTGPPAGAQVAIFAVRADAEVTIPPGAETVDRDGTVVQPPPQTAPQAPASAPPQPASPQSVAPQSPTPDRPAPQLPTATPVVTPAPEAPAQGGGFQPPENPERDGTSSPVVDNGPGNVPPPPGGGSGGDDDGDDQGGGSGGDDDDDGDHGGGSGGDDDDGDQGGGSGDDDDDGDHGGGSGGDDDDDDHGGGSGDDDDDDDHGGGSGDDNDDDDHGGGSGGDDDDDDHGGGSGGDDDDDHGGDDGGDGKGDGDGKGGGGSGGGDEDGPGDIPELNWRFDGRENIRYAALPAFGAPRPLMLRLPDVFAALGGGLLPEADAGPEQVVRTQAIVATPQPVLPLALAVICEASSDDDGTGATDPGDTVAQPDPQTVERIVLASAPALTVTNVTPPEVLSTSLGFGEGGLPDDFRAGPDVVPAPTDAPEFALILPSADRAAATAVIESLGGRVIRFESLGVLGVDMVVVDMQGGVTPDEVRATLAFDGIEADFDANHLYFPAQAPAVRVYANEMVGAVPVGSCRLPTSVRVGLIDGPVDITHPYLREVALTVHSVLGPRDVPSFGEHATALASLIAAAPTDDGFTGIAPGAEVLAAVAFSTHRGRPAASMEHIARAMDWLLSQGVQVINMSISGPENRVFRRLLSVASDRGAVLVGASGNDARSEVAWPAAAPEVIAVTAVDAVKDLYPLASYGEKVEFAAPGVDVLVAEPGGTAYRSGTSYAAAVLSALAAHKLGAGVATADEVRTALAESAEDLGDAGRDDRFGYGLVRLPGCLP
jgi:hypothetical protein